LLYLQIELTPATEVCGFIGKALRGSKTIIRIGVCAHRMATRKELSCDLCVTLAHKVLVDHAAAVPCVIGNMLLAHFVSRTVHPVFSVTRSSAKNISVYVFLGGQVHFVCGMASHLKLVNNILTAASQTDFTIDGACGLATEVVLGGHVSCVARQVLALPLIRCGGEG
jgi:hypothetical protein